MTDPHRLLEEVAAAAGYGARTIELLADATLPDRSAGALHADDAIALVEAIDVTVQAGMVDGDFVELVTAARRRDGAAWRETFWRGQLRAAATRAARPERYGVSAVREVLERAGHAAPGRTHEQVRRDGTPDRMEVPTPMPTTPDGERAEQLAAQIPVPVLLPRRLDGSRLDRLSVSSLAKFLKCPEEWRRHYLCRERFPTTPAAALGSIVDMVAGWLVAELIEGRPLPSAAALVERADHEREVYLEGHEVVWTDEQPPHLVEQIARDAATLYASSVVPAITDPIAVQRPFRFKLSPHAAWEVVGAIDVEETRRVRDTKVKSKSLYGHDVDGDVQASTYLLARLLEGDPAEAFVWDILLKPGKQRRSMTCAQVPTRRSVGRLRGTLIRYAAAARRMAALDAAFGPDQPWDFADPRHKLCSERFCDFFRSCAGGGGLADAFASTVEHVQTSPVAIEPAPLRAPDDDSVPAPPDPHGLLLDEIPA